MDAFEPKPKKKAEKKVSSDSTTLKGVLWPGMDLFDSATPEMKRMRNQRKDDSVLEHMIATSNEVEPNEIVYHPTGEVHHTRDIFGPLSPFSTENSPVSGQKLSPIHDRLADFADPTPRTKPKETQGSQDYSIV